MQGISIRSFLLLPTTIISCYTLRSMPYSRPSCASTVGKEGMDEVHEQSLIIP